MKNYEKYTTPEERAEAYVKSHPVMIKTDSECSVRSFSKWLEEDADELEPCPFCKASATLWKEESSFFVQCNECYARANTYDNKYAAIKSWNKRA